jgi:uncharacterized protein
MRELMTADKHHSPEVQLRIDRKLLRAARLADAGAVRSQLVAGASLTALDKNGRNAIAGIAPRKGRRAVVEILTKAGVDPNHQDSAGSTPLMLAVIADDKSYVRALLRAGASENLINGNGESALTFAIVWRRHGIVRILLRHGSNPNRPRSPWTPLMYAAFEGDVTVAKMLLLHGANPERRDVHGRTALEIAESCGHRSFAAFWRRKIAPNGK